MTPVEELQAEVEELRAALFKLVPEHDILVRELRMWKGASQSYRDMLREAREHHESKPVRWWRIVLVLVILPALMVGSFILGHWAGANDAVCHSVTEDSTITDCDYHDGGWYPED